MKKLLIALLLVALPICSQAQIKFTKVTLAPRDITDGGTFRIYYDDTTSIFFFCSGTLNRFDDNFILILGKTKDEAIMSLKQLRAISQENERKRFHFDNGLGKECVARKDDNPYLNGSIKIECEGYAGEILISAKNIDSLISYVERFEL